MKIRILITTPNGQAKKASNRLRTFLLKGKNLESHTNDEDNKIIWIYEGNSRQCFDLERKVFLFQKLMLMVLTNPVVEGIIKKKTTQEERTQLKDMLINGTHIDMLKEADIEDLIKKESWLDKIKDRLKL